MNQEVIDNIQKSYISSSSIHGDGLFASEDLSANQTLATLDGQIVSWSHLQTTFEDAEWNALSTEDVLFRPFKTKYYFINHSRTPNLIIARNSCGLLEINTIRKISRGEELLLDYRHEPLPDWYLRGHGASYL